MRLHKAQEIQMSCLAASFCTYLEVRLLNVGGLDMVGTAASNDVTIKLNGIALRGLRPALSPESLTSEQNFALVTQRHY
jgi:hypothetical protein